MNKLSKYTLLRGYINGNLGDDLFIRIICSRYKTVNFLIIGPKRYKKSFCDISNLEYINNDNILFKCVERLTRFIGGRLNIKNLKYFSFNEYLYVMLSKIVNLNVIISGSYYIEWTKNDEYWDYFFSKELEYYKNHPVVIGINFGPYSSEKFKMNCINMLSNARFVSVRDKKTVGILKQINPYYAPDIVFLFKEFNYIKQDSNVKIISIVVSNKSVARDNYITALQELIESYNLCGFMIRIICFCDAEGDYEVAKRISSALKKESDCIVVYDGWNLNRLLEILGQSRVIIAGRFHAMILGWLLKVPTVPICYSEKMSDVIKDIAPSMIFYNANEIDRYGIDVEDCINNYENIEIEKIKQEAEKHFKYLDKFYCN